MASDTTRLNVAPREIEGSRSTRRLRREGRVPVVLYGGEGEPLHFSVDARELRHALQGAGAVIELDAEGQTATAVVKDHQRDPVRNDVLHVDFVRVRMDVAIQTTVIVEVVNFDDSPGGTEGGVLEQQLRDLNIEALPGDIPESIVFDASSLALDGTVNVSDLQPPSSVTILDDPEEVVASVTIPRMVVEAGDAVETETEVVGEGEGEALATEDTDAEAPSDENPEGAAG
jgi:large subunit ribosomal protein L25